MYVLLFVSIDFQNVSALWLFLFIAIKRQWCLECILKFEGFAKTIDFLLRSDLQQKKCPLKCMTSMKVILGEAMYVEAMYERSHWITKVKYKSEHRIYLLNRYLL